MNRAVMQTRIVWCLMFAFLLFSGCTSSFQKASDILEWQKSGKSNHQLDPDRDLIILCYDHAPDKDDGHSAVADRTILQSLYGKSWISKHVMAVSGAYGNNANLFNHDSDNVMSAAWNDCGGWLSAHDSRKSSIDQLAKRCIETLNINGNIWVKEGGQSDITATIVKSIKEELPKLDTLKRFHVVQHSDWNERHTNPAALIYTKTNTDYLRIPDANPYLKSETNNEDFVKAATEHPVFGKIWQAAFKYYNPNKRLDFSDTGELMHILNLGQLNIKQFQTIFLE